MRVQRVVVPGSGLESWTVVGDDHVPVDPVERFMSYLASIERSPNTVKAYAHDLKDWFSFLAVQQLEWQEVTLEDVAAFVAWLRLPPAARDGRVSVLPTVKHHCGGASVNRKLAALTSFCEFHARLGVHLGGLLVTMAPAGRSRSSATSYKPFLQHITKHGAQRRRTISLPATAPRPQVLTALEAQNSSRSASTCASRLPPPDTEVTASRQPVRSTASLSMSTRATVPHRRWTSALIRRRFRASGWAGAAVSRIAPDARSEISSQDSSGSASLSAVSSASSWSRSSPMKTAGSSGLRSSR